MSAVELIKIILGVIGFGGIYAGIVWAIIEKKFDINTMLILSGIALLIMFNI